MEYTSNEAVTSFACRIKQTENESRLTSDTNNNYYHLPERRSPKTTRQLKTAGDINILHQSQLFDVYRHKPETNAETSLFSRERRRSRSRDDEQETDLEDPEQPAENDGTIDAECLKNAHKMQNKNVLHLPPLTNVFEIVKRRRSALSHRHKTPVDRTVQLDDVIYNVIKRIQPEKVEALKEREIITVDDQNWNPRRRCHRRRSSVEHHEFPAREVEDTEIGAKSDDAIYSRKAYSVRLPAPYGSHSFQPTCNFRRKAKGEEPKCNNGDAVRGSNGLRIGESSSKNRSAMSPFPTSYYVREIHANRENTEHTQPDGDGKHLQDHNRRRVQRGRRKLPASESCDPGRQMKSGDWNVMKIWNRPADQLNVVSPRRMAKQDIRSAGTE